MTRGSSRKVLLEIAGRLLREQGYAATSVAQISKESGLSRSSLYYLFPSGKAELAAAALAEHRRQLVHGIQRLQARYPYAREGFPALFNYFGRELKDSGYTKGSLLAAVISGQVDERVRQEVSRGYLVLCELLLGWLLRSGVPLATATVRAELALTLLEGGLVLSKAHQSCEPLKQALRQWEAMPMVSLSSETG